MADPVQIAFQRLEQVLPVVARRVAEFVRSVLWPLISFGQIPRCLANT